LKGTKIDVLLDPPQVCGSTDLQVGEFQVTIPGGVCPTDRAKAIGKNHALTDPPSGIIVPAGAPDIW
jgi:hypothetical protein